MSQPGSPLDTCWALVAGADPYDRQLLYTEPKPSTKNPKLNNAIKEEQPDDRALVRAIRSPKSTGQERSRCRAGG